MSISIYYDKIRFRLKGPGKAKEFMKKVIRDEKLIPGDLNYVFTDDKELRKINMEFLKRTYNTDVITFNYSDSGTVNGEIYISVERARENANEFGVSLINEVIRLMIHGSLHLCGYNDEAEIEKGVMQKKENERLREYFE